MSRQHKTMKKTKAAIPIEREDEVSVVATHDTISSLQASDPKFREFVKLAQKYAAALSAANDLGKQVHEALMRASEGHKGDVGSKIRDLASVQLEIVTFNDAVAKSYTDDVVTPLQKNIDQDKNNLHTFAADYKKTNNSLLSQHKKAEAGTRKAGKKGPEQLQQAIQDLTTKMKEINVFRTTKLREVLSMERKRFCGLLLVLCRLSESQLESSSSIVSGIEPQLAGWQSVANDLELPQNAEQLIRETITPDRTFVSIQGEGYDEYDTPISPRPPATDNYTAAAAPPPAARPPPQAVSPPPAQMGMPGGGMGGAMAAAMAGGGGGGGGGSPSGGGGWGAAAPSQGFEQEEEAANEDDGPAMLFEARAIYDFVGEQEYELSFNAGDIVRVYQEDEDGSGWFQGEIDGVTGPFPGNYVERL
eukprot:TRINITY_DN120_c0_g4_i2.p1 TRINITY_DN120_c0_g4~~TRINITY_DN120_c0_g4_i2.p1  ORF type:complete len:418 (-),score=105.54 TRINITY_DN120_c0_g4_i2:412-1665(-)